MTASRLRIIGNVLLSGISEGSNVLTFLLGVLAARYLGDVDFGKFSFALAFTALFQLLPDFGVSYASTIEIARDRSKASSFVGNIIGLQIITSLITAAVILGITMMTVPKAVLWVVLITALTMILRTFKLTLRWFLKSFQRFDLEAVTLVGVRTASFVLGWILLARGAGLTGFVIMLLAVQAVDTGITSFLVHRSVASIFPRIKLETGWQLLQKGFPFALMYSLQYIFFQINTVALSYLRSDAEVGWFNAPYRIIEGLVIIPSAISYGLLPTFSQMHATDKQGLMGLYRRALKYLLIMSLPLAIFISFESSKVIWLVFGKEYIRAIPIFKVLIWGSIFMFLSHLALTLMTCIDRQWTVIRIAATVLAINILLNITMVARYGMMGASWVSLLSEFCFTIFLVAALRRIGFRLERLRWLIRPLVACLIFAGVTYLTHSLPLIPQALLCGPALILSLFATRSFDDSEIAALTQVLAKFGLIRTRKAAQ